MKKKRERERENNGGLPRLSPPSFSSVARPLFFARPQLPSLEQASNYILFKMDLRFCQFFVVVVPNDAVIQNVR